ncbi:MAG: hypothetical protein ACON5B_10050 [Myxococcota bacterium]
MAETCLLAIDVGLSTGWAVVDHTHRVTSWAGHRFRSRQRYRRWARGLVLGIPDLAGVLLEGDRQLAQPFVSAASRRGCRVEIIGADRWRLDLFDPHEVKDTRTAKRSAIAYASTLLRAHRARVPRTLRHDAAEAICLGVWAAQHWMGWPPPEETTPQWSPIPTLHG